MIASGRLSSNPKKIPMAHPGHVSRTCLAVLPSGRGLVEHLPDLPGERGRGERLLQEVHLVMQHTVPDYRVVGVPGHEQHPQPVVPLGQTLGRRPPGEAGITTSVTSR